MGPNVKEFEAQIAARFAKRHGVMVNSGSSANYLAVELLGLEPGAEVITPALTFSTTVAPLVRAQLVPSFVDIEEDTFSIDVDQIEAALTAATRSMIIPSRIGNLPDWERISEIARSRSLLVIEDSADTLGAKLRGTSTGVWSDISTTSFYGSHVINCAGNGRMLCVNDNGWNVKKRGSYGAGVDHRLCSLTLKISKRALTSMLAEYPTMRSLFSRVSDTISSRPRSARRSASCSYLDSRATSRPGRETSPLRSRFSRGSRNGSFSRDRSITA
jgi:hypothetical protein